MKFEEIGKCVEVGEEEALYMRGGKGALALPQVGKKIFPVKFSFQHLQLFSLIIQDHHRIVHSVNVITLRHVFAVVLPKQL